MRHHLPYYHVPSPFIIVNFFAILTNTKFVQVTFTYHHKRYLVFEFTVNVTYFIGLVIFSVVFVFSVSNTKYHILCSIQSQSGFFIGPNKKKAFPKNQEISSVNSTPTRVTSHDGGQWQPKC